jgi:hypothetical protein
MRPIAAVHARINSVPTAERKAFESNLSQKDGTNKCHDTLRTPTLLTQHEMELYDEQDLLHRAI